MKPLYNRSLDGAQWERMVTIKRVCNDDMSAERLNGATAIAPQATHAWNRIPAERKAEIIAALEQSPAATDFVTKPIKVGKQVLMIGTLSSGFCIVYAARRDHNTIVSVMTPRETRIIHG